MVRTRLTAIFALVGLILGAFVIIPTPAVALPQSPQVARTTKKVVKVETVAVTGGNWVVATKHPSALSTLSRISRRVYGTSGQWQRICDANKLSDCDLIEIGQRIYVPTLTEPITKRPPVVRASRSNTSASGWTHPLASGKLGGSCWGAARTGHTHKGVDISQPSGTPVRSVHSGRIVVNKSSGGAGNYVAVDHGNGVFTLYMHFRQRSHLPVGTTVGAGQTIGYVGSTGSATGPHLHFEVHKGLWNPVNPAPFMRSVGVNIGC